MNTCELRCGGARQYKKTVQIGDVFLHPIYKLDQRYGWMAAINELPALLGSWIGNAWDFFECVNRCLLMLMNWNYLREYEFIEFNLFRCWIWQ
jgi:hypothetical protein